MYLIIIILINMILHTIKANKTKGAIDDDQKSLYIRCRFQSAEFGTGCQSAV